MPRYEYKVVPAPTRGSGGRQVKGAKARFAHALSTLMNEMGSAGWEYIRADTLPCDDRSGLFRKVLPSQPMLVFRRLRNHDLSAVLSVTPAEPFKPPSSPIVGEESHRPPEPPMFSPSVPPMEEAPSAAAPDYNTAEADSYYDESPRHGDESAWHDDEHAARHDEFQSHNEND